MERYIKKGSLLYLEGKITHRSYESNNETRYTTEIVVSQLQMLNSKSTSSNSGSAGSDDSFGFNGDDFHTN